MSAPCVVLKALNPTAVRQWESDQQKLNDAYLAKVAELEKEMSAQLSEGRGWRGRYITGYAPKDWREEPRPGYRKDKKTGFMVPARRTPEGKAEAKKLSEYQLRTKPAPGLPEVVMGDGFMGPFRIEHIGRDTYAWLGFDLTEGGNDLSQVDFALWSTAKLSEFHAAREATS